MLRSITILVQPSKGYPVTRHRDFPSNLNRSRFQFTGLEYEALAGLRGDPFRNVVLVNGGGAHRRPA